MCLIIYAHAMYIQQNICCIEWGEYEKESVKRAIVNFKWDKQETNSKRKYVNFIFMLYIAMRFQYIQYACMLIGNFF